MTFSKAADDAAAITRIVVVEGRHPDGVGFAAEADTRLNKRLLLDLHLQAAAMETVAAALPWVALVCTAQAVLGLFATIGTAPVWASAVAALVIVTTACTSGLRHKQGSGVLQRWAPAMLLVLSATSSLSVLRFAEPAAVPVLAAVGCMVGLMLAWWLAPMPRVWPWAVALPVVACASAALALGREGWLWAAAGALAVLAGVLIGRHCQRAWRMQTQAHWQLSNRLDEIEQERDDAYRANTEKSRFLAIASHDLRQPVHALGLFAATLQRRLQHSPDEPLARNLLRAVDGLERSFNAMLDISRLDSGALTPKLHSFPLREMFRRLHMHYGGQAELAGLGLRFSPGGKSITSDPQLLERVVGNLIQNAIKYTASGGIVVVARSTETHLNIEVWDTGCGVAAAELPRIFDEFYQVGHADRDRARGLGMGLAIVKRLATLMGHRLEVASQPGRGTMFRVGAMVGGLPGIEDDFAPADTVPMTAQFPQMVLVVDDEEPIREGLRLLLQEWGYQAMTAANADQVERAVSALEGRVDLVLSDLHLGGGPDGEEVIANVRRLCGREVPAILITGEAAAGEAQRLAAGSDPVLFKPVQPRRLFEAIREALD